LEAEARGDEADDIADVVLEAERLSRLVDQLLELSREGSAGTVAVDVGDVVDQRLRLWEGVADEQAIELGVAVDTVTQCSAAMVPDGLEQVLDNLLDNAIRYSPPGGVVTVSVERELDGSCLISVADTGPGVPDEDIERLFDRFWRGASDQPGTGLGLAIVDHLVTRAGGTVSASETPGGGLTVTVRLLPESAVHTVSGE
ncbi:hypothetical protein MNBD_ACTINO01-2043, partial [hydrothermal vent metagenome]